ncbi:glycoside hydrolase family 16 protein [Burkholderia gladioli]
MSMMPAKPPLPLASDDWTLNAFLAFADGPDIDRTVWTSPQWAANNNPSFFGQTAIANQPDYGYPLGCVPVENNRAQLVLSTWNPCDAGKPATSYLGSQISTIQKWGLKSYQKVAFWARVKCPVGMPGGAVASLFSYNLLSSTPFQHDEIDFEFASNYWQQGAGQAVNTNVYVDDNTGLDQVVTINVDTTQDMDLLIIWSANDIKWYIGDTLVRTETGAVPQSDMSMTLNFWVPASSWSWAYNGNFPAPASALTSPPTAPGTQWIYEVAFASVFVVNS